MSKSNFISALESSFEDDCNTVMNLDIPSYAMSEEFTKKMEKLIKRQKKPYFLMTCTAGRRVACIVAAVIVLSLSSLSVEAVREAVHDFFMNIFSDHAVVSANSEIDKGYPTAIEDEYYIDNIPAGFEEVDHVEMDNSITITYFKDDQYIFFEQHTKTAYAVNYDNEHSELYYTDDNGQEYLIHDTGYDYTFIWDNGQYIFEICSNLDKKSIQNLCEYTKVK